MFRNESKMFVKNETLCRKLNLTGSGKIDAAFVIDRNHRILA